MTAAERKRRWRERRRAMLQAPSLVARVADSSIPGSALTEFEQIVRAARLQVLDQLGGADPMSGTCDTTAFTRRSSAPTTSTWPPL